MCFSTEGTISTLPISFLRVSLRPLQRRMPGIEPSSARWPMFMPLKVSSSCSVLAVAPRLSTCLHIMLAPQNFIKDPHFTLCHSCNKALSTCTYFWCFWQCFICSLEQVHSPLWLFLWPEQKQTSPAEWWLNNLSSDKDKTTVRNRRCQSRSLKGDDIQRHSPPPPIQFIL